jgi:hypothetical protein
MGLAARALETEEDEVRGVIAGCHARGDGGLFVKTDTLYDPAHNIATHPLITRYSRRAYLHPAPPE